ncbi:methyltransferase family protein [Runella sp.]|uniref:methyltransferase family protein n=1 Tax=Runella sp. TaxID=1960881 RepID=UPI003D127106
MILYLLQIFLWFAYGALHSVLANNRVKLFFEQKIGTVYRYYRLIYNVLAVVFLSGIIVYQFDLPEQPLWMFDWRVHVVGGVLKFGGLAIVVFAIAGYNVKEFSGLAFSPRDASAGSGTLKTDGLLHYVRHPIYTGTILFVWGLFLSDSLLRTMIMAACVTIYTLIGIYFEERKLLAEFGNAYRDYRRRVPMLLPKLW